MYTPFDFSEAVGHRRDYIDERLREGSPVVGLATSAGLLIVTVRRSQRKVYEIYDRHMFSAIGNQSDIEAIRLASINMAHQEGFERSPDDVSMHRLVGFTLSPAIKKGFGDPMVVPFVLKALFAEASTGTGTDCFYVLNYDGEFRRSENAAVAAGTSSAEDKMLARLGDLERMPTLPLEDALTLALRAWCAGAREALQQSAIGRRDDDDISPLKTVDGDEADRVFLRDELKDAVIEAGLLERKPGRDVRFRLLTKAEIEAAAANI
jgi:proteasome alpha subunit